MWKNAVLSIRKNVGRTILLLGVAFLIINLVMAGLEIRTATEKSMDATRQSLGSDVTLAYNMKALMSNRSKGEALDQFNISIKVSDANELSKLKYVTSVIIYSLSLLIRMILNLSICLPQRLPVSLNN